MTQYNGKWLSFPPQPSTASSSLAGDWASGVNPSFMLEFSTGLLLCWSWTGEHSCSEFTCAAVIYISQCSSLPSLSDILSTSSSKHSYLLEQLHTHILGRLWAEWPEHVITQNAYPTPCILSKDNLRIIVMQWIQISPECFQSSYMQTGSLKSISNGLFSAILVIYLQGSH